MVSCVAEELADRVSVEEKKKGLKKEHVMFFTRYLFRKNKKNENLKERNRLV